jgi:SAM-dependent methyltransferase
MPDNRPKPPPYLEPYQRACDAYGPSFEATLWASREWQEKRFRVFTELFCFRDAAFIDAGAGQGDFVAHLIAGAVRYRRAVGLEAVGAMLESARARALDRCEFLAADFVAEEDAFERAALRTGADPPDAVVFSGSLNTLDQQAAQRVLDRAWRVCGRALLFNFLSARVCESAAYDTGPARRFCPLEMLDWALRRTPCVALRKDYIPMGHDATILMLRP